MGNEIKIALANEIAIPGKDLLRIFSELLEAQGPVQTLKDILRSDIFIYRDDNFTRFCFLPTCDCSSCTEVKEIAKDAIRRGEDKEDISSILDAALQEAENRHNKNKGEN